MNVPPRLSIRLGDRSYDVVFGALAEVPAHLRRVRLRPGRCLVVTDAHVAALYEAPLVAALRADGWTPKVLTLAPGEASKAPGPLQALYDAALTWGVDRQTPLLALGGGVVGDLAGFAAATLLRGVPFVQLPTTLIAQVDSALGGKTGINHATGKNLIGAFHQPRLVYADQAVLATLPEREWTSGLAEVVKHALIADAAFFDFLQDRWEAVRAREAEVVAEMVYRAAQIKATIVSEDERERGRRTLLNFGHTFGHALERAAGYGHFTHGEAVALGMRAALHLSHQRHPTLAWAPADALVQRLPVPAPPPTLAPGPLIDAMQTDKKAEAGQLRLVLLRDVGAAYVTAEVERTAIEAAWAFALHG